MEPQTVSAAPKKVRERVRSQIAFPYVDLDAAQEVADAINANGGSRGDLSALAGWMRHDSVSSGAFRNKIGAARMFGLVEKQKDTVLLTPLGRRSVDPTQREAARAEAFRRVPLYGSIYKAFEGGLLPDPAGVEEEMRRLGVPEKQTDKARQAMMRSAEQAGYFASGKDRLTTPSVLFQDGTPEPTSEAEQDSDEGRERNGERPGYTYPLKHSGDSITVSLSRDVLRLAKQDREFVLEVITNLEEYKDSKPQNETSAVPTEAGTGSL